MAFHIVQKADTFDIYDGDRLFTSCVYDGEYVRPFMGPVYATNGESFTRFAPHHEEHPHQRSVFVGIGDVNGVDFWNEVGKNKGKMILDSVLHVQDGETAEVSVKLVWKSIETDKAYLDEVRTLVFEKKDDCIAVHVKLLFTAAYEDVTLGKTKEAGPLGIRVADELRVDHSGRFTNSEGGVNEDECWSKEAKWCNYEGTIGGKKVGIAYYDRKSNRHYPTAWHIRNYGLMAANNFFFKSEEHIPKGETLEYNFLLCFWEDTFNPAVYED